MKAVIWVGSSRRDLKTFPATVRREAGFQLHKLQGGQNPDDWKPMTTIGMGVCEIRIRDANGAFRVIYVASIRGQIHVLHCFQKKTQATSLRDLQLAKQCYQQIRR